eukprot:scaffold81689_cov38-Prasinocladus_malaysianus.AAC.1
MPPQPPLPRSPPPNPPSPPRPKAYVNTSQVDAVFLKHLARGKRRQIPPDAILLFQEPGLRLQMTVMA